LTRAERKEFGPVQIVVVGFDDLKFQGDILPELRRLRDLEIVRLVGMVIIAKSHSGELVRVKASDLTEEESASWAPWRELSLESERPGKKGLNPRRALAPKLAKCGGFSVVSRPGRLPRSFHRTQWP
jgi:hypothetical protein